VEDICYVRGRRPRPPLWIVPVCVFIIAVPITKLFAWGERDSGGHVLRETTSLVLFDVRTREDARTQQCGCHSDRSGPFGVVGLGERRRLAGTTSRSPSTAYAYSNHF
jgi:hypothetical protein